MHFTIGWEVVTLCFRQKEGQSSYFLCQRLIPAWCQKITGVWGESTNACIVLTGMDMNTHHVNIAVDTDTEDEEDSGFLMMLDMNECNE